MLSFVFSGIVCGFVGLCYAELEAMIPVAGSAHTYAYATIGEISAWIIGWDLILEYAIGASTVAVGRSGYTVSLLKRLVSIFHRNGLMRAEQRWSCRTAPSRPLLAMPVILVVVLTAILLTGTRESTRVNNVMVAFKLFVVAVVVLVGAFYVRSHNWVPFIPATPAPLARLGSAACCAAPR